MSETSASVVVRFKTEGAEEAKRAIAGLTQASTRAEGQQGQASRARTSEVSRAEHGLTQQQTRETQKRTREALQGDRAKERSARQQTREVGAAFRTFFNGIKRQEEAAEALAKKAAQDTAREKKKQLQEVAQAMGQFFDGVKRQEQEAETRARGSHQQATRRASERQRYAVGLATAAVTGGIAIARQAQGTLGIRSQEEILSNAVDMRQAFITQTATAGVSRDQREQLLTGANDIGRRTGVSPEALTQSIMTQQELFSVVGNAGERGAGGIRELLTEMEGFARIARATGSDVNDVASAGNAMRDQFHLSSEGMMNSMFMLSQGAQDGSLSMRDFAQQFPQVFGSFLTARGAGARGEAGAAELSSVAQAIRRQQGAGPEAAARTRTLMASMLTNISDRHVQQRLRGAGVRALDRQGNLRPIAEIAAQMTGNRRMRTSTQMRSIFGDAEATSAWQAIVSQEAAARNHESGAMSLTDRQRATAAQGRAGIDRSIAELDADSSGRAVHARADREANVLDDSERLIGAMVAVAGPLTQLQDDFPRLSMAMESLLPVLQALAPGIGATLLGGGAVGTAGAAAGAAGVAGVGGTVAAGTAAVSALAPVAAVAVGAYLGVKVSDMLPGGEGRQQDRRQMSREMDRNGGFWATLGSAWRDTDFNGDGAEGGRFQRPGQAARVAAARGAGGGSNDRATESNTTATDRQTTAIEQHTEAVRENSRALSRSAGPDTGDTRANGQQ